MKSEACYLSQNFGELCVFVREPYDITISSNFCSVYLQ